VLECITTVPARSCLVHFSVLGRQNRNRISELLHSTLATTLVRPAQVVSKVVVEFSEVSRVARP